MNSAMNISKKLLFLAVAVVFALSWIKPLWPREQILQSSLTVAGMALLWFYARQRKISDFAFFMVCLFLAAHCVGARWLYSYVPYEKWLQGTLGFSVQETFGWTRNHYDRLVHFLYGLCFMPALMQYFRQKYSRTAGYAFVFGLCTVMVTSLFYEWFEWGAALMLSAQDAESYNGQQGDMWDAHKDMLLATLGALIWLPFGRR